jgi:tyrosyl-tRNA synthetase
VRIWFADGAVWLDEEMLSPFDYFQYFRNTQDEDVSRFLRLFTNFSLDEICAIEKKDINEQKEILAQKVTEICHGRSSANESLSRAKNMFSSNADANLLPQKTVNFSEENKNGKKLIEILRETNLVESGGEAKRLIKGGGVKIDGKKIDDENHIIKFDEKNPFFKVALGKKKIFRVNINLS